MPPFFLRRNKCLALSLLLQTAQNKYLALRLIIQPAQNECLALKPSQAMRVRLRRSPPRQRGFVSHRDSRAAALRGWVSSKRWRRRASSVEPRTPRNRESNHQLPDETAAVADPRCPLPQTGRRRYVRLCLPRRPAGHPRADRARPSFAHAAGRDSPKTKADTANGNSYPNGALPQAGRRTRLRIVSATRSDCNGTPIDGYRARTRSRSVSWDGGPAAKACSAELCDPGDPTTTGLRKAGYNPQHCFNCADRSSTQRRLPAGRCCSEKARGRARTQGPAPKKRRSAISLYLNST